MLKLLLVGALGIGAFAPPQPPQPPRQAPTGPYRQLFTVKPIDVDVIQEGKVLPKGSKPSPKASSIGVLEFPARQHAPKDKVERGACNMPIIVADASIDPGILITKKHGTAKIRAFEPPACWTK